MMGEFGADPRAVVLGVAAYAAFVKSARVKEIRSARLGRHFPVQEESKQPPGLSYQFSTEEFDIHVARGSYKNGAGVKVPYFDSRNAVLVDPEEYAGRTGFGAIVHTATDNEAMAADMFHHVYTPGNGKQEKILSMAAPIVFPLNPNASSRIQVLA